MNEDSIRQSPRNIILWIFYSLIKLFSHWLLIFFWVNLIYGFCYCQACLF